MLIVYLLGFGGVGVSILAVLMHARESMFPSDDWSKTSVMFK